MNIKVPKPLSPTVALAICEITVGTPFSYGIAWMWCAKYETPSTSVPSKVLMMTNVRFALTCSGVLKSATPSEIASSPVSEDPPFAKARRRIKTAAKVSSPCSSPSGIAPGRSVSRSGRVSFARRHRPIPKTMNIQPTKK